MDFLFIPLDVLFVLSGVILVFLLASTLAVYSYGRFAERVRGKPSHALETEDTGTELDRSIAPRVEDHPDQSGLMLMPGNLQAFAARAHAAKSAGRSLDMQYYYWRDDLTGGLLAREIVEAADRGVRVRLLIDDINTSGNHQNYLALDSHPNIEVRLFNPCRARANALRRGVEMLLRIFSTTRRMHNKAWIADGRLAIVGGRNIGDAYFDASEGVNFRDMDLLLLGKAVQQTEAIFDSYWNSTSVLPVAALERSHKGNLARFRKKLDRLAESRLAQPYLHRVAQERNAERMLSRRQRLYWSREVTVVSDPPEKAAARGRDSWLARAIFPMMIAAERELQITSPYFIPGEAGVKRLASLAQQGVEVSILTNSLASTDVAAVYGAYANYRKTLLEAGVKLFELRPQAGRRNISLFGSRSARLHTKAFTTDGHSGFIGSFNFDPRSVSLNTEMGVIFRHGRLVEDVRDIFDEQSDPENSYSLALKEDEIVWLDGREGAVEECHHTPEAGFWRRLTAAVIGILPVESQL
ncbi:phospholipase D family protein [Fodinicurvata halophila]|uniref:Phospholipase D n=2 Tax=Fodinicurvata halophila TaxID=1419723 RepID=A0ABV8UHA5_9PROT